LDAEPASTLERSRSAMWPLALALIVGIALGFGVGYGVGSRDKVITVTAAPAAAAPPVAATPGREFTESAVSEPPKPASTPAPEVRPPSRSAGGTPPDAARGSAPDAGRLFVKSTPAGAQVFVDGRDHGRTPTTIR